MASVAGGPNGGGGSVVRGHGVHVRSTPVLKPLLNQLSSSIRGQFRRVDRAHATLKTKLDASVKHMHERIWKLQSRESADVDLSNWHSKEDLRTYLTAMSLLGSSSAGGGRTAAKEKHNFFSNVAHFKESLEQARSKRRDEFLSKLKRLGISSSSKKAAYLWQQINERDADVGYDALPQPTLPEERQAKNEQQGAEEKEASQRETAEEDADLTAEDEDQLRVLARDSSTHHSSLVTDAATLALLNITTERGRSQQGANGSTPYGVAVPGRRVGQPISAPRVFRKGAEELEEEAEERAEAAAAEAARKAEEEQKRKLEAEQEVLRERSRAESEAAMQPRGNRLGDRPPGASRRGSLVRGSSVTVSRLPTPLVSRRASLVGAAGAMKALTSMTVAGQHAKRQLQSLGEASAATGPASGGVSDEQFAADAARVMGMVFANPGLAVLSAQQQVSKPAEDQEVAAAAAALASHSRPSSTGGLAVGRRAAAVSLQEEIERWNAKTPLTSRSLAADGIGGGSNGGTRGTGVAAHKSILTLAAEKLGVSSVGAVGGPTGKPYKPEAAPESITAAYLASFDQRMPHLAAQYHAEVGKRKGGAAAAVAAARSRPASATPSASATPRRSPQKDAHFGRSMTSTTSNLHSTNAAIEFDEPRARKEIVDLAEVGDPAELFKAVEKEPGSTLMAFEQLHVTNRALAEEARKRAEQAAQERAAQEVLSQRQAEREAVELHRDDTQRDRLAQKSRARSRASKDPLSPAKSLAGSPSAGALHAPRGAAPELPLGGSGRDYVHLSPLLVVPKWDDVARSIDYATLVPGYVRSVTPVPEQQRTPPPAKIVQLDAEGFPIETPASSAPIAAAASAATPSSSANIAQSAASVAAAVAPSPSSSAASAAAASSHILGSTTSNIAAPAASASPEPTSPSNAGLNASASAAALLRSQRRALERQIQAQLDDELWAGTPEERKKEVRRRVRLAMEPSPLQQGPSIFQRQKEASLRHSYAKFAQAARDPHALPSVAGAQRYHTGHTSLPTSPAHANEW